MACRDLTLDELIHDDLTQALMRADGVDEAALRALQRLAAAALPSGRGASDMRPRRGPSAARMAAGVRRSATGAAPHRFSECCGAC